MQDTHSSDEIYVRFYAGHKGLYGHEFIEFEIKPNGRMRYANNTKYRHEGLIHKQCTVSAAILAHIAALIEASNLMACDDAKWPLPDKAGCSELEIILGARHIAFTTSNIGSVAQVNASEDSIGLARYFYLVQDLKSLVLDLMAMHFKIQPL